MKGKLRRMSEDLPSATEVTKGKRAEALLAGEKRLLEMVATGFALPAILDVLCQVIEEQRPDTLASVLLLSSNGTHLESIAGPKLPKAWTRQMARLPIG